MSGENLGEAERRRVMSGRPHPTHPADCRLCGPGYRCLAYSHGARR